VAGLYRPNDKLGAVGRAQDRQGQCRRCCHEPRVGGAGMSAATMAAPATWGRVLVWEPASRLVLTWDIDADLQYDPALQTEIEVRIIAEQDGSTRVELKHRRLDRFGNRRDEMRAIYDKAGDWGQLLVAFAQAAETSAKAAAT
jgi:uncharacterized protein YndB with AHSA1/START domain